MSPRCVPPYLQRGGDVRNLVDAFVLLGGFHADTVFAEADHFIMQGNVPDTTRSVRITPVGVLRTLRPRIYPVGPSPIRGLLACSTGTV